MGLNTIAVRVAEVRELASDVRGLTLVSTEGTTLPAFSPGSHVVVHLQGNMLHRNPYSLASSPWDCDEYRIAVRRVADGRGGSRHVHERISPGDVLQIEPPRNLFAPVKTAARHVLVAGGIGATPFVSYIHQLRRDSIPFELHYAVRDLPSAALQEELLALCSDELHVHVDPVGTELIAALENDVLGCQPLGTHLSVCGPPPMMEAVLHTAARHGWPHSRLHLERFTAETGALEPFEVVLAGDGRQVHVPAKRTLLEALEDAGLDLPYLCRQGVCGECRTNLLGGIPDHRDVYLNAAEHDANRTLMPCVSRCVTGPLILDLP